MSDPRTSPQPPKSPASPEQKPFVPAVEGHAVGESMDFDPTQFDPKSLQTATRGQLPEGVDTRRFHYRYVPIDRAAWNSDDLFLVTKKAMGPVRQDKNHPRMSAIHFHGGYCDRGDLRLYFFKKETAEEERRMDPKIGAATAAVIKSYEDQAVLKARQDEDDAVKARIGKTLEVTYSPKSSGG